MPPSYRIDASISFALYIVTRCAVQLHEKKLNAMHWLEEEWRLDGELFRDPVVLIRDYNVPGIVGHNRDAVDKRVTTIE